MAVALTAPESFRFTFPADPARHVRAAELLGATRAASAGAGVPGADADERELLPSVLVALMRDVGLPNGLAAVGYADADVPDLVAGAVQQQRLLSTAPRDVTEDDLAGILRRSLTLW
jgi:alcohol dehydrogenase class IV